MNRIKPRAAGLNAALLSRKSGAHQKPEKAVRRAKAARLQKEVREVGDIVFVHNRSLRSL